MVIGVNKPVFVYHRKMGMMLTNVVFKEDDDIRAIIDLIARQVNRRIDQQTPILDARLPDGSRINATIPRFLLMAPHSPSESSGRTPSRLLTL